MVEWLFLAVPWGCLRFVIVVFPDHTHLLFLTVKSVTHVRYEKRHTYGQSPYVVPCNRRLLQNEYPLPPSGQFFPYRKVPILKGTQLV